MKKTDKNIQGRCSDLISDILSETGISTNLVRGTSKRIAQINHVSPQAMGFNIKHGLYPHFRFWDHLIEVSAISRKYDLEILEHISAINKLTIKKREELDEWFIEKGADPLY